MADVPVTINVPKPPSANRLWRSVPGRKRPILNPDYAEWKKTAGWLVKMQIVGVPRIDCRFDVEISVPVSRRDTDNWTKPLLDLCQHVGLVSNDGNMHQVTVTPMVRDDCVVRLLPRPDIGAVRKPARSGGKPGYTRPRKPTLKQVRVGNRMGSLRP